MKKNPTHISRWQVLKKLAPRLCRGAVPVVVFCAWIAWLPNADALGVRIPNQDASAIARGNAFVATADNPSAIYYNPAGITQLEGHRIQIGSLFYLGIYGDHKNSTTGARIENDAEIIAAPTLHYTFSPEDCPLSFGFGAYVPFGFSVDWPDDAPFRTEGIKGDLTYITLNPVIAWRLHPTLSIAAGPTFNYSEIDLVQGIFPVPVNDEFEFEGDGWGYGFNVGLLWQPHPQWSFGASYRSASRTEYKGDATFRPAAVFGPPVNTSSKFDFPQIIIGGVSYRPTTNWNIELNVDWADWSSVDNLTFQGLRIAPRRLDWQSSFMYGAGVTRYFRKGYYASVGYFFSEKSTPEEFFTPLVPDTDLHIGSLGGGYKGAHWSWALAVQIIAGDWRNVTVDGTAVSPTVNGSYRLFTPTLSFSAGYSF